MTALIFGGTGFIGRRLTSQLEANSYISVVRDHPLRPKADFSASYSDLGFVIDRGPYEVAIDLAANVSLNAMMERPVEALCDNLAIAQRNVNFLSSIGFGGRLLYVSSDRVEGEEVAKDGHQLGLLDPYAESKRSGERLAKYAGRVQFNGASVIRLPNLYGPGQTSKQLIPEILDQVAGGQTHIAVGSLSGARNYLHVDDAVAAIKCLMGDPKPAELNRASGQQVEIAEVASYFSAGWYQLTGRMLVFEEKPTLVSRRARFALPPVKMDDSYFRERYGWRPKINMDEGVKNLLRSVCDG